MSERKYCGEVYYDKKGEPKICKAPTAGMCVSCYRKSLLSLGVSETSMGLMGFGEEPPKKEEPLKLRITQEEKDSGRVRFLEKILKIMAENRCPRAYVKEILDSCVSLKGELDVEKSIKLTCNALIDAHLLAKT